jgi:hypothetical protein
MKAALVSEFGPAAFPSEERISSLDHESRWGCRRRRGNGAGLDILIDLRRACARRLLTAIVHREP